MSFLKSGTDGATGLGSSLGLSGSDVKNLGAAFNGIASAGGASPGYGAAQEVPQAQAAAPQAPPNNVMQLLDPNWLRAIMDHFRGSYQ